MVYFSKWKIFSILAVCLFGILYALPNLLPRDTAESMQASLPSWLPGKTINLGLDLQGGAHLLMQVDVDAAMEDMMDSTLNAVRQEFRKKENQIGYLPPKANKDGFTLKLRDATQTDKAKEIIRKLDNGLYVQSDDDGTISATLQEMARRTKIDQTIQQSIEIVRRRVDETGTREPIIARQGDDRILLQLPGVEDPEEIKRNIGKTAKLGFHLVDNKAQLDGRPGPGRIKLPYAEDPNQFIVVEKRAMVTGDMLETASPSFQDGMPVVSFRFNGLGARRFCDVTRDNVGFPFAVVLDKEVISAPVIRDAICGGSGIISGGFTVQEASDLALLLRAGALPAPLTILEERTVGPSLGADSVEAGKIASIVAMTLVLVFMALAYGRFGMMANVALLVNVALIFALLSALQATLTLPGIAGIVLTIGMAVDANVLIFERIREESRAGRTPISSIDSGYGNVMSTIVDANFTTLIAAMFLYALGSGPVKGFAVTLAIGILTSMFSAIMVTRLMVVAWLRKNKPQTLPL